MERREPFISRVRLKNYKSIAECDVRLGPLTVLVGPNGSGKSNFLDALAFLGMAFDQNLTGAIEKRVGLTGILRVIPQRADSFSIDIDVALPRRSATDERATGRYGFEIGPVPRTGLSGPFQVIRETCELHWGNQTGAYHRDHDVVYDSSHTTPVAEVPSDRLYLPVAGAYLPVGSDANIPTAFTVLLRRLSAMRFYNFDLDELRSPRPQSTGAALGRRGEHLADVLGALQEDYHTHKERLDSYLQAVVPNVTGIERWFVSGAGTQYVTVLFLSPTGVADRDVTFEPRVMSDGTLRAAAVLAALFQPGALDGRVPVVGIEEPEIALHPAAAGVLFDALTEASQHVQVLATSQSSDLLDRDDLDVSTIRAVSMENGLTVIGEVDEASRQIVKDKLYTLGELMRGNQIPPQPIADGHAAVPKA